MNLGPDLKEGPGGDGPPGKAGDVGTEARAGVGPAEDVGSQATEAWSRAKEARRDWT